MKLQVGAGWFRPRRLAGVAAGLLALLVWSSTSPTLSAWTAAVVGNQTDTTAAASLAFSHSAGSCSLGPRVSGSAACSGSVLPTAASTSGTVTGTDSITNNGTALASSLTSSVSAASCAPVKLDNAKGATDVMLPRYGASFRATDPFGGTNAIGLDGTAYAAAVTKDQQKSVSGQTYAMGVWFKAAAGQEGPLFSIDTSPVNAATSGGDDRTVYLGADGKLNLVYTTGGARLQSALAYDDNTWHFVYITLADTAAGTTVQMSADTRTPVQAQNAVSAFSTVNGYWHLGWASTALMGTGTTAYFTGSLSNLVVFNGGSAPAQPTAAQLASQGAFTTWASSATDHWLLGDTGTTTYAGSNPVIGATSPCGYLNVVWSFTSPAATAVTSRTLAAFATGSAFPVGAAPGPAATQASSVAITRAGGYVSYVSGLRLLIPVTYKVQVGGWSLTYNWASSDSVVLG